MVERKSQGVRGLKFGKQWAESSKHLRKSNQSSIICNQMTDQKTQEKQLRKSDQSSRGSRDQSSEGRKLACTQASQDKRWAKNSNQ